MGNMDGWDIALLAAAGYIAVTALVRLMLRRRDEAIGRFRQQLAQEQRRRGADDNDRRSDRERAA